MKKLRVLMQTEGTVISQNPWIGLHEKIETRTIAMHQAMIIDPTILVATANHRPGKRER